MDLLTRNALELINAFSFGIKIKYIGWHKLNLKIGNIEIAHNIILAPLAGITDQTFREICRRHGAGFAYSEMISAKSIVYDNANTKKLLDNAGEHNTPWAVQLFGHEPDVMAEALKRLEGVPFDAVDINMGCPVPKVVRNGEGAALMNDPQLAGRIVEASVKATVRPVTVKIRKGFSPAKGNAVEIARIAEANGASAVAVHGRTRDQMYSGHADWDIVAEVKGAVKIPVIGSGDIFSYEDALRRLEESGCDGIMAARGALGNPWIFSGKQPDLDERIKVALEHLRLTVLHKGGHVGIQEMRKHLSWYVKGLPGAAAVRVKINAAKTEAELRELLLTAYT
jgi:nifR3 family TIM-barrel protein